VKNASLQFAAGGILLFITTPLLEAQPDRISNSIDGSRVVVLTRNVNPNARAADDQGAVDPSMAIPYATLYLKPSGPQQAALETLLMEQQDPGSSNYRRWVTPEEFADRFGLSGGDIAKLTAWLKSAGLTVNDVARGRRWITFSGTAASVGTAFHTEFHHYVTTAAMHFANATAPSVPEALADVVAAVGGLDDYDLTPAYGKNLQVTGPDFTSITGAHFLTPSDIATIYDLNPLGLDGSGQKIAVVGNSDINLQDIRNFRAAFGLPPKDPLMMLTGPDPMSTANLSEADIDLEWSGAVATSATIIYVYARSVNTAAQYAVDQRVAPIITMSYGGCEQANTPVLQPIAQQANAEGITWVASTGDVGAAGCERQEELPQASKGLAVQIPASIPEITAVGGTEFNDATGTYWGAKNNPSGGSALSYIPEMGWNDSFTAGYLASSGGGASIFFPKPSWQTGPGVPNDGARDIPDIALSSSWDHDGYITYTGGGSGIYGGTSVATPEFAGFLAILNQYLMSKGAISTPGLGNVNPVLYHLAQTAPSAFHDIIAGNNIVPCMQDTANCATGSFGYSAGPGYDLVTGLGSIDAYNLATNWAAASSTSTTVTASPSTILFNGANVQLTATVTSSSGTPSGNVTFLYNDTSLGTATLTSSGASSVATLTVSPLQLPVGSDTITAEFDGSSSLNGSSGTTTVQVVTTGGSAVVASIMPNPVYEVIPVNGFSWVYIVELSNQSNVPTTLTKFTIDGVDDSSNIKSLFGTSAIPANGLIFAGLEASNLNPPVNRVFGFAGVDPSGATWTQQITVQFVARVIQEPSLLLTTPATAQPTSPANPSCQWPQPLLLEEQGGYDTRLTNLTVNGANYTGQLQQIFGTTTIAPFGMLQGTLCWNSGTAAGAVNMSLLGATVESGAGVITTASTTLAASAPSLATPSVSPALVSFLSSGSASLSLGFSGGAPAWTAQVTPATRTASWLTVSPLSGAGPAQLALTASSAGLANGVYNATVLIQSVGMAPQFTSVQAVLVVGGSPNLTIGAVSNAASGAVDFAPGMLMSVYGTNLAPKTEHAGSVPLPLSMQGVSATVSGISAPLLDVLPGQLNIQVPYETGAGPAVLGVNNNGQVAYFTFQVTPSAPGIFMTEDGAGNLVPFATGQRGQELLAFITGEGDVTPALITGSAPTTPVLSKLPAPALPVTLSVGGVPATIDFAGIPDFLVGVTQINFTIPAGTPLGPQPVIVTVGGVASPPVTLTVTQ
jgi:uncharacterized protein (TIGR03437 family)